MTFVYRYYNQAELERQLNARATVPDITPILTRYASESARMRARLPCRLSVSYGATEPERLDSLPAATAGPAPIFVFLHGAIGACSTALIPASWPNASPRPALAW